MQETIIPSIIPDITYIIGQPSVIEVNSLFKSTDPSLKRIYSLWQRRLDQILFKEYDNVLIEYTKID